MNYKTKQAKIYFREQIRTVSGKAGTAEISSSETEWCLLCQVKLAQYVGVSVVWRCEGNVNVNYKTKQAKIYFKSQMYETR